MAIVYKTINKVNGKFYYGVHHTGEDDGYLGSGINLKRAVKKYGKENFERHTLTESSTEECYEIEELLVDEEMISNPLCYNIASGGNGNPSKHSTEVRQRMSEAQIGKKQPEIQKDRISKSLKKFYKNNPQARKIQSQKTKGRILSKDHCDKISKSRLGIEFSQQHKDNLSKSHMGLKQSKETIQKRVNNINKIILNTETGIFYFGSKEASESANINQSTLRNYLAPNNNKKNKSPFKYV